MRQRALAWTGVIAVAFLVAHACGYRFGVANQTTYFLHALQHAHPDLYRHDWLVSSTSEYHTIFSFFAGLLFELDDVGALAFGITHVVLMVALIVGMYLLVRATTPRATIITFILVLGWVAVNGERSIAGSYIWSSYLQPSLIGAAGWIIGLAMYARGRPLAAGIALAIGGLFHVNFLILGIGAFGLAELVVERDWKRLAWLLAPQLVALAILAPEILAHASSSDPDRSLWVLVQFHAPLHYKASWIARTLPRFIRWPALAVVVAPVAIAYGNSAAVRRLVWWAGLVAAICVAGTLVMIIPTFLPLTRLYVWRLAPFAILAAQIVCAIALAATVADVRVWRTQPLWRRVVTIVLVAWIAWRDPFGMPAELGWIIWIAIAAVALALALPWRAPILLAAAIATLAMPMWNRRDDILHPVVALDSEGPANDQLYAWARTTPVDTVFLTSPATARFRLVARRATYADFKSPPLDPDGLVEWHERLCRMDGAELDEKIPAHYARWQATPGDELLARAKQLGVDYLVLERSPAHDQITAAPVFATGEFAVYRAR